MCRGFVLFPGKTVVVSVFLSFDKLYSVDIFDYDIDRVAIVNLSVTACGGLVVSISGNGSQV